MYIISNQAKTEVWSNENGWVDADSATRFSRKETQQFSLPTDGQWVALWEVDSLQFIRLIAECESYGVFSNSLPTMRKVAEEMDLDLDDLFEIISRAQERWDKYKTKL